MSPAHDEATALVVEVPEADEVVGDLRLRHDRVAPLGMPAHVTVLYPFRRPDAIRPQVLAEALDVIGDLAPFTVTFDAVATFPAKVVYLVPDPPGPFVALTAALVRAFPDCQPYGGQFSETIPHLTIGHADDDAALTSLVVASTHALDGGPITSRVEAVSLFSRDATGHWTRRTRIPLGTDPTIA